MIGSCSRTSPKHDIALYPKMEKNPLENVMLLYDDALIPLKSGQEEGCKVECRVCSFPFGENVDVMFGFIFDFGFGLP